MVVKLQLHNTAKTRDTAGTGDGVAEGIEVRYHTHTRQTRGRNTAGEPVPVLFPTS